MGKQPTPIYGGARLQRPPSDTPLSEWLKAHGVSYYELAQQVGCDPKMVSHWALNRSLPSLVNAFKIDEATGGGVPPEAWLGTNLARMVWEHNGYNWEGWRDNSRKAVKRMRARNGG